uniref:Uncharacterized protein n=1 Tax=Parascaris univalens TaxID=6257 RepID=A0A915A5U2_PARUN
MQQSGGQDIGRDTEAVFPIQRNKFGGEGMSRPMRFLKSMLEVLCLHMLQDSLDHISIMGCVGRHTVGAVLTKALGVIKEGKIQPKAGQWRSRPREQITANGQ